MTQETEQLFQQVMQLPAAERELLAIELMTHLHEQGESLEGMEAAWHAEIERRAAASDSGETSSVAIEEAWPRILGKDG